MKVALLVHWQNHSVRLCNNVESRVYFIRYLLDFSFVKRVLLQGNYCNESGPLRVAAQAVEVGMNLLLAEEVMRRVLEIADQCRDLFVGVAGWGWLLR